MHTFVENFEKIFGDLLEKTAMNTVILSSEEGKPLKVITTKRKSIKTPAITSIGSGLFYSINLNRSPDAKGGKEVLIKTPKGLLMYYKLTNNLIVGIIAEEHCKEGLLRMILKSFEKEYA